MDDLSSFVEGIVSQLGQAFLLAGFMPAVIFIAINQYVLFSPAVAPGGFEPWNLFPAVGDTPLLNIFTGELLTTVAISFALGLLLVVFNQAIIRSFEGLTPVGKIVFGLFGGGAKRQHSRFHYGEIDATRKKRLDLLAEYEETGEIDEDAEDALIAELHRLHITREKDQPLATLPFDQRFLTPTAFGNAWALMEEYPRTRYGLDGVLFWPYIREIVAKQNGSLLDSIDNQKLIIDVVINLALMSLILAVEAVVLAILWQAIPAVIVAVVSLVLFFAFYGSAVSYARTLGVLVTKTYDLYRLPLLDQLDLARPETLDEEYWVWQRLAAFIRRGEPFYFDMLIRAGEDDDEGEEA